MLPFEIEKRAVLRYTGGTVARHGFYAGILQFRTRISCLLPSTATAANNPGGTGGPDALGWIGGLLAKSRRSREDCE